MAPREPQSAGKEPPEAAEAPPPLSEWIMAAAGLLLVLASIGYLLYDTRDAQQPPAPAVRVMSVEAQGGRFLVRLQVFNESRATASALRVKGELQRGGAVVESSELEFDYLPGRSSREGGLFFSNDPRAFQLLVTASSYRVP